MKQEKKQFTVERIRPENGDKLYIGMAWNLLLSVSLLFGSSRVFWMQWETVWPSWGVALILALLTLIFCMLGQRKREKIGRRILFMAVPWLLMLIITGFHGYWTGGKTWVNMIFMHWNELNDGGVALFRVSGDVASAQAFTLLMVVLLTQVCWWLVSGRRVAGGIVYTIVWILLALKTDVFRPYIGMLLIVGLIGMFLAIQGGYITIRNLLCFVTVAGVTMAGVFLVSQEELQSVTQIRQQGKEQIHTWRYGTDVLPEGDLRQAAMLRQSTDEMLEVWTEQQKMLYLRGFVGEVYQDGVWHELPGMSYGDENTGILKWLKQQGFDPLLQVARYYSLSPQEDRPDTNQIQISVKNASRYYLYTPISVQRVSGMKTREKRAARLAGAGLRGASSYSETEVSASRPSELTVAADWVKNPETEEQQQYCKAEAVYRDFVYENYTQTDEKTAKLMNELFWNDYQPESDGIYSALTQVRTILREQAQYVEEPEAAPEGQDPITWFLTESGQGNSVQYASAATEALRVYGIPARYVEGYFISEEEASLASDERISVSGKNAHAWVEIYFDGIGWLPVDVTPGYYFDAVSLQQMVSMPDVVQKNVALNDTGFDTNIVSGSDKQSQKVPDMLKKALNVAAICLGVVGLLIILLTVIFLIVEIWRIAVTHMWKQYEKEFSNRERIAYKRKKLFHLLEIHGIDASLGWNTENTNLQVAEAFPDVMPDEYRRVCVLLEKAEYGGQELQCFEERTIDAFIEKIRMVEKSSGWRIRMRMHYEALYDWKYFRKQRR